MAGLYLYTRDEAKQKGIEEICRQMGMACHILESRDFGRTAGELTGLPVPGAKVSSEKLPPLYMPPELLLMAGLSDNALDTFLAEYKARNLAPIALKAVVTPFNAAWPLYQLADELKKEHARLG